MSSFTVKHWNSVRLIKLWKSVKRIKFECKLDLEVFSSWMEQNSEVLVIFKLWPESVTRTLGEILKIDWFWSLSSFTVKLWKSVKIMKYNCKDDVQVFSWWMEKNYEVLVIFKFWPKSHKSSNSLILKFVVIHCKAVEISENDQIQM